MTTKEKGKPQGDIIVACDKMELEWEKGVQSLVESVITWSDHLMERTIFKVNDLLADIWMKWIKEFVDSLASVGHDVSKINWMFDPKWNDISNTVENYLTKLKNRDIQNVKYLTVMASWNGKMMRAAVKKRNELWLKTKLLAVTVFTSMDDDDSRGVYNENVKHEVLKLSKLALSSWMDGIVCSPIEAEMLREVFGEAYPDFEIVTPGIRLKDAKVSGDDQKRTKTPGEAIEWGSSHLVVGRPIIQSPDRIVTIEEILTQMDEVGYKEPTVKKYQFEKLLYMGGWEDLLKYIGAIYKQPKGGALARLASKLLSNGYINIGTTERDARVLERASEELAKKIDVWNKILIGTIDIFMEWRKQKVINKYQEEKCFINEIMSSSTQGQRRAMIEAEDKHFATVLESLENTKKEHMRAITPDIVMWAQMGSVRLSSYVGKALDLESIYCEKKDGEMILSRHDIDLKWKNVILSEDVITKWSTLEKMIEIVEWKGGKVIQITCVVNRSGSDYFRGIPIQSCYVPEPFDLYYDDKSVEVVLNDKERLNPLIEAYFNEFGKKEEDPEIYALFQKYLEVKGEYWNFYHFVTIHLWGGDREQEPVQRLKRFLSKLARKDLEEKWAQRLLDDTIRKEEEPKKNWTQLVASNEIGK